MRTRKGARSAGDCSPEGPGTASGSGGHPPARLGSTGRGTTGPGRAAAVPARKLGGLREARALQDRRAAARPPLRSRCIRGKELCGDVPLLQALPARPGCHRDIASPLHGARLPRPTCLPTATESPANERTTATSQRPLLSPAGQQQAPAKPSPAPRSGRL